MSPNSNDLGCPDSAIRLAAAVHRFRVPRMPDSRLSKPLSYSKSFTTAGQHPKTKQVMLKADTYRSSLKDVLQSKYLSYARVVQEAKQYNTIVYQILLSCKLQPEESQLDVPLVFEWLSGIEQTPKPLSSTILMYELVMAVTCEGLGRAGSASECSGTGEFSSASRDFAAAAGIFHYLAHDLLPTWVNKGGPNVKDETLPSECNVAMAQALQQLFEVNGQQMEVAAMMVEPGILTKTSILGKLCFGTAQQLESFMIHLRKDCKIAMDRMEKDFFTLVSIQIGIHKSLSNYFQAREVWAKREYGVAIALLRDSMMELKTRDGPSGAGIPDISKVPAFSVLNKDLRDFRMHQEQLFKLWKHDNSSIFFERVPAQVPATIKLHQGENISKREGFKLEVVEPVLLKLTCDKSNILRVL